MKMTTCWRVPAPTPLRSTGRIRGRRRGDRIGSLTSVIGTNRRLEDGQSMSALHGTSDINLFCYCQSIIHFDAEISDHAFDLGVAKQKLDSPKIARAPVNQSSLRASERVCSKSLGQSSNPDEIGPISDKCNAALVYSKLLTFNKTTAP